MCGIAGLVKDRSQQVSEDEVLLMNDKIIHRGPDAGGVFVDGNIGLGHRRLSIIDLSEEANQPMIRDQRYHLVFNGEIYNYLEIKAELQQDGCVFTTASDTEVIIAAYKKWGKACVDRFNGMWAFALYDSAENQIFMSRDRFGIKPVYYCKNDQGFFFGSEIRQLLPFNGKPTANSKVLVEYMITGIMDHTAETFFKGIHKLRPGHNLVFNTLTGDFKEVKYYSLADRITTTITDEQEAISTYREELERAIEYRLRSDVTVGTCLSGGMDSSLIASISAQKYFNDSSQRFKAIHARSSEKKSDESEFAKLVAANAPIDLHLIEPNRDDFLKHLDEVVDVQEEPFRSPSIYMQYFVMKKAREIGATVMLDGQGGDETMLGYNKYFSIYLNFIRRTKGFAAYRRELKNVKENTGQSLKGILKFYYGMKYSKARLKAHLNECSFVNKDFVARSDFSFLSKISESVSDYRKLQILELESTNLPILLRYEDKNSMHHSIETRLPLIDHRLVETALKIPVDLKMKGGWSKYILRKASEDVLPRQIVWRKDKIGFEAPSKTWLTGFDKNSLRSSQILTGKCNMDELIRKFDNMNEYQQWRVISVAKWEEKFDVGID